MEIVTTDVYRLFNHQYERNNYFVHFPVTFSSRHMPGVNSKALFNHSKKLIIAKNVKITRIFK